MKQNQVRNLVMAALCVALGVALPQAFHAIPNAGSVLLPMHIPVLLCGLTCGWPYGLACGILAPLTSSLITGMPGPAYLPAMVCELAAYGLISGLTARFVRTGKRPADLYIQLISAMLLGRAPAGAGPAAGFVINPFGANIVVPREMVAGIMAARAAQAGHGTQMQGRPAGPSGPGGPGRPS